MGVIKTQEESGCHNWRGTIIALIGCGLLLVAFAVIHHELKIDGFAKTAQPSLARPVTH